jgi:hypothetical protein
MNLDAGRQRPELPWQVAFCGLCILGYGCARVLFASILVASVLKTGVLPSTQLLLLSALDAAVGIVAIAVGLPFLYRREWAGRAMRCTSVGLVMYDVGRRAGLAFADRTAYGSSDEVLGAVIVVGALMLASLCARSSRTHLYFTSNK